MPDGPPPQRHLLDEWELSRDEVNDILTENPSARGNLFGYVAEYKLRKIWLQHSSIRNLERPREHRSRHEDKTEKGDFRFEYRGQTVRLEVKSLDTPSVRTVHTSSPELAGSVAEGSESGLRYEGTFQCNASDTREVILPNDERVTTNCLVVGEFDVLAVNCFEFGHRWRFAFAANDDLPRSTWRNYSPVQQKYLLKSSMKIAWPLSAPFDDAFFRVLDSIVSKRRH